MNLPVLRTLGNFAVPLNNATDRKQFEKEGQHKFKRYL
ncbi:hypothetical protein DET49_113130 [Salegentibacter sp. 24]|nr:hypothetical protein DET49_113130 [Salegentibacter sp. 24]